MTISGSKGVKKSQKFLRKAKNYLVFQKKNCLRKLD